MSTTPCLPPLLEQALEAYKTTFRRPELPEWDRGELLALFPDLLIGNATKTWRDSWPFGDRAGVYFVFGREMKLLYIGKASMNNCMGARLSHWFWGDCHSECKVHGKWSEDPFFVQSLAMPAGLEFEAPALEEFLIREINPPDNTAGRKG